MINRICKSFLYVLSVIILTVGTSYLTAFALDKYYSIPKPIHGPIVFDFDVVGMDGNKPVKLVHEWSGSIYREVESLQKGKSKTKAQIKPLLHSDFPVVWADTGRATKDYRYYLTKADLPQVNSLVDSGCGEIKVSILKDDPLNKRQTIQVELSTADMDRNYFSVYQVDDNRVWPIKWTKNGREVAFIVLLLLPGIIIFSVLVYGKLLKKLFYKSN